MKTKNISLLTLLVCCTSGALAEAASPTDPTPLITRSADTLIGVLQSGAGRKEKADACRELAVIGTSKAVPVLVGLLADEELSHMARYALETIPGASVDQALRDELTRLKGQPLVGVIGSVGVRKDPRALPTLFPLLGDSDPQVSQAAARALGKLGTAEAARAIENALPSTASANRLAFCEGLFRCAEAFVSNGKTKAAIALYDRLRARTDVPGQVRAGALRGAIIARERGGLGLLKESLVSSDPVLFNAAVRASLEMTGAGVTRALASSLPQLQSEHQIVVMQALGSRGDDSAVPALSAQAGTGPPTTRLVAIRALAATEQAASVPVLVDLIEDSDHAISQAALDSLLAMTGREADLAVLTMLKNQKANRRATGIDLAGRRRMVAALPALLTASADSDPKLRSAALQRLGNLGTPAEVPALIKLLLRSTDAPDLNALAEALRAICVRAGSPALAAEQIIGGLPGAQPAQKAALLGVLGAVGGPRSLVAVRVALTDPNPEIRAAAVRALSEWPDSAATPDLLPIVRSAASGNQRELAFRGYVRLARESGVTASERLKMLTEAASLAASAKERMLVLSGLGDIPSVDSLRLVTPYLSDPAVANEAGAVAVQIAEKLDAKDSAEIGKSLNQVLKSAKSPQVLDKARKRMDQLKLPVP